MTAGRAPGGRVAATISRNRVSSTDAVIHIETQQLDEIREPTAAFRQDALEVADDIFRLLREIPEVLTTPARSESTCPPTQIISPQRTPCLWLTWTGQSQWPSGQTWCFCTPAILSQVAGKNIGLASYRRSGKITQ